MDLDTVAAYYRGKGYVVRDGVRVTSPSGSEHKVPLLAEGPLGSLVVFFGDFGGVDGPEMGGARKVAREIGATPVLAADEFSNKDRQVAARLGVVLLDTAALNDEGSAPNAIGLGVDTGRAWPGLAPVPTRRAKETELEPHPWPASGRVGGHDGPATRAVDVEEILAHASAPRTTPAAASRPSDGEEPPGPTGVGDGDGNGEGLWKRPRARAEPTPRAPRASGSPKFGWLGTDASASPATEPLAVEYDGVVSTRPGQQLAESPERLGDTVELQPTMTELEHKARRDRLLRRLFWLLFASVLVYLFALWWF
ncbi:MAG: hypothetical protein WC876_06230 [Candidatus Thermoplasmatota archaeon]